MTSSCTVLVSCGPPDGARGAPLKPRQNAQHFINASFRFVFLSEIYIYIYKNTAIGDLLFPIISHYFLFPTVPQYVTFSIPCLSNVIGSNFALVASVYRARATFRRLPRNGTYAKDVEPPANLAEISETT